MTAESGISISVGLDTSPFQKDLAAFRTMSEKAGKQVAQALENSVSPTKITKGFNDLARSINTAAAAGKNLGASINVSGLDSLAKQAGVSASGLDKMYESMVKNAQNRAFTDSLRNIQKLTGASADEMNRLAKSLGGVGNEFAASKGSGGTSFFGGLSTGAVAAALSIGGVITTLKSLTDSMLTMSRLTTSYQSIFGSQYGATQQLDQIYNQTQAVGLQFQETAQAAKTFFAAAQGSTLAGEANNIFNAVSKGAAALQMSTDDVNGVDLALGQMISKGKVQAEELRGQLGERLPGAFQLAAKAMNMSTAELDKFMADGKLTAEDLLPKLAQALEVKYADAAKNAANSIQGSINRMSTEWTLFKANVLDSEDVVGVLSSVANAFQWYNREAKASQSNLRAIKEMEAAGVVGKKDYTDGAAMDDYGPKNTTSYTQQQIDEWNAAKKAQSDLTQAAENEAKAREAIYQRETSVVKDFLKNEKQAKSEALAASKDSTISAIDAAIKQRTAEGGDTSALIKDHTRVLAEYQAQLEKINKEAGGKGLANKQFKFDTGLEQLRQEVANMEATINPASLGIEKLRNKLELEKQNALAAAEAHAKLSVQRKEATPAEAEEKKSLEVRKAELTYTQKMAEAEEKGRQTRVEFYKDFADLSGNYTESLQAQAEAIARQGEEYRNAGIPEQLERQWEALKKLQTARDPMSGTVRGLRKYANEATDLARGMEDVWGNAFKGMEDAIVTFAQTGKMSFTDMANSIIADLIRIAVQSSITGPLASGIGNMFSGMFGSWTTSASTGSAIDSAVGWVHHTGGMVGDGSAPTRSVPMSAYAYAPRFHSGGGFGQEEYPAVLLRGERVLNRDETRGYNAAMALARGNTFRDSFVSPSGYGSSNQQASQPQVYLNINNSTGEQVSQQVKTDNNGNIRADIWVGNTAAKQMAKPGTAANQTLRSGLGIKQRAIGR